MNFSRHSSFCFFLLFIFIFGVSCSSHPPFGRAEEEKGDLVDTFNLGNAGFDKFKVGTPLPTKNIDGTVIPTPAPEATQPLCPIKPTKKTKKEIKDELPKMSVKGDQFPKDYPEEIKGYDTKYRKYWDNYKPIINKGEQFVFKASYIGVTAGYMEMTTMEDAAIAGRDVFHIRGHLTSADYYRYVYTVDDKIDTYIDKKTFTPMKYSLIQRESGQSVDDLQIFDRDNYKSYFWYKRIKKNAMKNEEKSDFIPRHFQDSFSALHFVRGFPLKIGDYYEFPVYTRAKIWVLKLWVEEEEEVSALGKDYKAIRIRAQTHFPGVLKANDDIFFWFSSDAEKIPLKFKAKVKIGSIAGELIKYTAAR